MFVHFLLFVCLFFSVVGNSASKEVRLFHEDGTQVENYDQIAGTIPPGTKVIFGDRSFVFRGFIDSGGSEYIYDIGDGKALRIAKYHQGGRRWPNHFLKGYPTLQEGGVAVPHVYIDESVADRFTVVERVPKEFSLEDLIENRVHVDASRKEEIWREFVEFAETTSEFSRIADFKPKNIVWTGAQWLLLDWDSAHVSSRNGDPNVFNQWFYLLPPHIYRLVEMRIRATRQKRYESQMDSCRALTALAP